MGRGSYIISCKVGGLGYGEIGIFTAAMSSKDSICMTVDVS